MAKLSFITNGWYVFDRNTKRFAHNSGTHLYLSSTHGTLYPTSKLAEEVARKLDLADYEIDYCFDRVEL